LVSEKKRPLDFALLVCLISEGDLSATLEQQEKEKPSPLPLSPMIHAAGITFTTSRSFDMTTPVKAKEPRALVGVTKLPDGNFTQILDGSLKGLLANTTIYNKTPVDLTSYGNAISAYEGSIPAANDGGKTAIAQKNKLRGAATKMYKQLAHYVEANCNEDMATFLLSGFPAASTTRVPPAPLDQPQIASAKPGPVTGEIKVKVGAVPKALNYTLHYAPVPPGGGTPTNWTEQILTSSKAVIIFNLTPGTVYMFQVKGLGRLGYTNWSDPVSRMAT
jgi:hypothetical protein